MAVQIVNAGSEPTGAVGSQYGMIVNPDGSINVNTALSGTITTTAGSQVWVQNTIFVTPSGTFNVGISGNIVIGSVSATVDSVYIQSGANIDLGSAWTNIGSVLVSNFPTFLPGSVNQNTNPWIILGSTQITNNLPDIGSYTGMSNGSVIVNNFPATYPGSVAITTGSIQTWSTNELGSVFISTNPVPISGTININAGSNLIFGASGGTSMPLLVTSGIYGILRTDVNTLPVWTGVGSIISSGISSITGSVTLYGGSVAVTTSPVPISGLVNQGTNPWIVLGSFALTNTGSVIQYTNPWIVNGSTYSLFVTPTLVSQNPVFQLRYVYSGTATGVTGSEIGSILQIIGATTYTKVLTYTTNVLTQVGSWV